MKSTPTVSNTPESDNHTREALRELMRQPFKSFADIARERHAYWLKREAEGAKSGGKRAA